MSKRVSEIGANAFNGCSSLESIVIPSNVTKIERETFINCTSLTTVEIQSGVTEILWNAFKGCTNLKTIVIPETVNKIGSGVFSLCKSIDEIHLGHKSPPNNLFEGTHLHTRKNIRLFVPKESEDKYRVKWYHCNYLAIEGE